MQRVVYAPEIFAYVSTSSGAFIDLSPDIISGTLERNVNDLSRFTLMLQNRTDPDDPNNPRRTYLGGLMTPMDRITVYMKRDRPVQVFSGYIDLVPYIQPYPRPVQIEASCTLKRLEFTQWDPSLLQVVELMFELGFSAGPAGLQAGYQQIDPLYGFAGMIKTNVNGASIADTGFTALLRFLMEDVGQWNPNAVYIEPLPVGWINQATKVWSKYISDTDTIHAQLGSIFNSPSSSSGTSSPNPATSYKGDLETEMRAWIKDFLEVHAGLSSAEALTNASTIALQANSKGQHYGVDPRLLVALAALGDFGRGRGVTAGAHNLFGGPNTYSSYAQVISVVASLFQRDAFPRTSFNAIVKGSWYKKAPAGVRDPKATTLASDAKTAAKYYEQLLDQSGEGKITWPAAKVHPTKFGYPTNDNPRKKPVATAPSPAKSAYVQLHAVGEAAGDPKTYAKEKTDNINTLHDLQTYIEDHPSWKIATDHYKGFDNVNHDISIFIRHFDDISVNGKSIGISIAPTASASSETLATYLRDAFINAGLPVASAAFKRGIDSSYKGLTKDHGKAAVVVRLPAVDYESGRPDNDALMLAIANAIYKYKFKVWDASLTPHSAASTATTTSGYRIFPKAYFNKVIAGNVASGQEFTFTGTVPFYALASGRVSKVVSNFTSTMKKAIFIELTQPISGHNAIWYAGGQPESSIVEGTKIKAGQKLGVYTNHEHGEIGFATTAEATAGKAPGGNSGLPMHNLLVNQMPGLRVASGANHKWSTTGTVPKVPKPPVTAPPASATEPSAFNATLTYPITLVDSQMLTGFHSFENDIKLADSVQQIVTASMRVYSSLPDGSFIAWYPDYFNLSGTQPWYYIAANEVIDFTVDLSDKELITHSYVIGAPYGPPTFNTTAPQLETYYGAGMASIDMPGIIDSFFNLGQDENGKYTAEAFYKLADAANNFFNRYGVRPQVLTEPSIRHPLIEFFYAYHTLMQQWAKQYVSNVTLTFLPELFPGMTAQIATNDPNVSYCVYVEQVTHNFDYQNGFTTNAQVSGLSYPISNDPTAAATSPLNVQSSKDHPGLALTNNFIAAEAATNMNSNGGRYNPNPVQVTSAATVLTPSGTNGLSINELITSLGG